MAKIKNFYRNYMTFFNIIRTCFDSTPIINVKDSDITIE